MNIFSGIEYKVLKDVNLDRKYDGIEYDSDTNKHYILKCLHPKKPLFAERGLG